MLHNKNRNLCLALVVMMMVVGVSSAYSFQWVYRYREILVAHNPVPATQFQPNGLRFKYETYDKYDSYDADSGLFVVPAGKGGKFSFETSTPKLAQGHYVVYTSDGEVLAESKGATYLDHGQWESYIIYDVYMEEGDSAFVGYTPEDAEYTPVPDNLALDVTFRIRRQVD